MHGNNFLPLRYITFLITNFDINLVFLIVNGTLAFYPRAVIGRMVIKPLRLACFTTTLLIYVPLGSLFN